MHSRIYTWTLNAHTNSCSCEKLEILKIFSSVCYEAFVVSYHPLDETYTVWQKKLKKEGKKKQTTNWERYEQAKWFWYIRMHGEYMTIAEMIVSNTCHRWHNEMWKSNGVHHISYKFMEIFWVELNVQCHCIVIAFEFHYKWC